MKKINIIITCIILSVILSACSNTPINDVADDNSTDNSIKQESDTDNFLKTITAETAEHKGICGANLTWYYKDNVLVIKGKGEMTDYLPPDWDKGTPPWNDISEDIALIIVQDGVTSIGANAFNELRTLVRIDIASSVIEIREKAFNKCYNLKQVNIEEGLKILRYYSFGDCNNLDILTVPSTVEEIEYGVFDGTEISELHFKGKAPKFIDHDGSERDSNSVNFGKNTTIYYSDNSFDKYINDEYIWIKE